MTSPHKPKAGARLLKTVVLVLVTLRALLSIRRHRPAVRFSAVPPVREDPGMHPSHAQEPDVKPLKKLLAILVALQVLLALTIGSAFLDLGPFNVAVNLVISLIAMLLLMAFFMHESAARNLTWVVSAIGFVWLAVMIGLALADYLTRVHIPSPW